ncbi:Lrp/AsnC family leucine-responsive transcriptional regulator [Pseudomonas synxantha]|nr:Lrp/AsnC family leucine-responsive transcriptional regulator [Pseudomonas synxantha]
MRTNTQTKRELDKIDRNILRILQTDGRISFTELGEKVGLSTTPCTERVRRLEREGIIMGYNARLNPQHLKGSLLVFVEISLDYKSGDTFEEFRRAVLKLPHVLECHLVSGDFDYLGEGADFRDGLVPQIARRYPAQVAPCARIQELYRDGRGEREP